MTYAITVASRAYDLAVAHFGSRFKTYRRTPALQVTPADLPMCAVYILREQFIPWGAANHAEPKFDTTLTLGLSGAVNAETSEQNEHLELEQWMGELLEVLLSNPKFVNLAHGITGMDRRSQFAKVGETTLLEVRIEMMLTYHSSYPPKVVDDLETVHIETQFPDKEHADSGTPQITRVYDIEQNS